MLLQFSLTNHRSIKDQAIISMKANADKSMVESLINIDKKKNLVPVMAIYGANAAGKSNVLHGLMLMKEMVCGKYAKLLKGEELPQEAFEFQEDREPTSFEIIFYFNGIKYAYGYEFNKKKILNEYLYHWPHGREALIFSRENDKYEFRENIQEQVILSNRTPENRLYLTSSNEWNCAQTANAFAWFQNNIVSLTSFSNSNAITVDAIRRGGFEKSTILKEMLLADFGICDVVISGTMEHPIISTFHQLEDENGNAKKYALQLGQESIGTQKFFSRIGLWMEAMKKGAVLVVDEIEASMHPLLTKHLIEMVQDSKINVKQAQLIFTTHDTCLLDLSLLRRDQIWFAEKNEKNMQTDIYALTEFAPRKEENVAKGYLQGRYGAIPFVNGRI